MATNRNRSNHNRRSSMRAAVTGPVVSTNNVDEIAPDREPAPVRRPEPAPRPQVRDRMAPKDAAAPVSEIADFMPTLDECKDNEEAFSELAGLGLQIAAKLEPIASDYDAGLMSAYDLIEQMKIFPEIGKFCAAARKHYITDATDLEAYRTFIRFQDGGIEYQLGLLSFVTECIPYLGIISVKEQ